MIEKKKEHAPNFERETPEITKCYVDIKPRSGAMQRYEFTTGTQAYIFCTSIYNGFYSSHSDKEVKKYICYVEDVYYKDDIPDSCLSGLCDFMAAHWSEIMEHEKRGDYNRREILIHFYEADYADYEPGDEDDEEDY